MKKYHIADLLTLCEIIIACTLLILQQRLTPEVVFWLFIVGELCDAFDGICARRWHYPDDGKKRWWREWAPEIDQISDILLLLGLVLYLITLCGEVLLIVTIVAVLFFVAVELLTSEKDKGIRIFRRYVYLACIVAGILILLYNTKWKLVTKIVIAVIMALIGITLIFVKKNRLTQVKTPL